MGLTHTPHTHKLRQCQQLCLEHRAVEPETHSDKLQLTAKLSNAQTLTAKIRASYGRFGTKGRN